MPIHWNGSDLQRDGCHPRPPAQLVFQIEHVPFLPNPRASVLLREWSGKRTTGRLLPTRGSPVETGSTFRTRGGKPLTQRGSAPDPDNGQCGGRSTTSMTACQWGGEPRLSPLQRTRIGEVTVGEDTRQVRHAVKPVTICSLHRWQGQEEMRPELKILVKQDVS